MQDIPSPCTFDLDRAGLARKWGLGFQQRLPDPLPTSSPSAWEQHPVLSPATQESIFPVNLSKKETQLHTPKPRDHLVLLISTLQASGISSLPTSPSVFVMSWTLITPPLSSSSALLTPVFLCSVPAPGPMRWPGHFSVCNLQKLPIIYKLKSSTLQMVSAALPWALPACSVPAASALHFTRAAELSKMLVSGCLQRF